MRRILSILVILLLAVPAFAETYEWKDNDGNDYKLVTQKQALLMSGPFTTSYYYDWGDLRSEQEIANDVATKCEKSKAVYKKAIADMKAAAAKEVL